MDILTFLIRLIEAVAWPVAAVFILLVFRKEFRKLLPLIRKIKAGPIEAEFERDIQEITEETDEAIDTDVLEENFARQQMLWKLAEVNPRSAILEAWLGVESAIRRAALQQVASSPPPDVSSPLRAMRELAEYKAISHEDNALFHDLRGLRNQAAHLEDFNPSHDAAVKYVNLASRLEARLQRLAELR